MDSRFRIFNRYLVCYGPDEGRTGVKGIRSDAPSEAIEAYIDWFRDTHRYPNGRKYNKDSRFVRDQIIDVEAESPQTEGPAQPKASESKPFIDRCASFKMIRSGCRKLATY